MEEYINYVSSLFTAGYDKNTVYSELIGKGFEPTLVDWLIEASNKQAPRSGAAQNKHEAPQAYPNAPKNSVGQVTWVQKYAQPAPIAPKQREQHTGTSSRAGWLTVLFICLIPLIDVAFDRSLSYRFGTIDQALVTISDMFALIGLYLYVVDLVMATRISWIEDMFGGLNKVYKAHAILGCCAMIAIIVHPLLYIIRFMPYHPHYGADFLIPSFSQIDALCGIIALGGMLVIMVLTLYVKMPYRTWLRTHKLLGIVYIFVALHVLLADNRVTDAVFVHWSVIVSVIAGFAALIYRTLFPNIFVNHYNYLIGSVIKKASGVITITLLPINRTMKFQAGQFVFISFNEDGLSHEAHPFTISSAPSDGSFSLTIKSLGSYTETIERLLPDMTGMTVNVEGAYGRFTYRNFKNVNQIWIAGGIGITPFLSMAQSLGAAAYNIDLYYSVRSEAEMIDVDILAKQQSMQDEHVFRVIPFVTEKYQAHLTAKLIQATSGDLSKRDFLLCGSEGMMADMEKQLLAIGVSKRRIHSESFAI
jgi:predicted ferric reductase